MKNLLLFIQLLSISVISQAQVEKYFVRNQDLGLEYEYPEQVAIARKAIDLLDASQRIEIIGEANRDAIASHLLEVEPSVVMGNNMEVSFTDSTQIIKAVASFTTVGRVDMLVTDVKNGDFAGSTVLEKRSTTSKELIVKYKDVGWAPKTKYEGDNKKFLDAKLDKLFEKDLPVLERDSRKGMVASFTGAPADVLFPFRMKIVEAAEVDDDEAEKVIINAGTTADLYKRERMVVYRVTERMAGKKKFEHFEIIGRLKFEKDDAKGGFCDVLRGKKAILAAIKAGETLYCVKGFTPYTKKDQGNDLKIALMISYPNEANETEKAAFYRRTRLNLSRYKGIKIIERQLFSKIEAERTLQKQEQFINAATVDQFKSLGADMVLEIDLKGKVDKYNEKSLTSTLNLIDVETNKIQGTKTIPNYNSKLSNISVEAAGFMKESLPPVISIIELTDGNDKKQTADEVLIAGDFEFSPFTKYDVFRRRMIEVEGEMLPRFEKVGVVAQRESEGDGIVNCKVKDGEKEIYAAIKAGDLLVCSAKAGFFEKMTNNSFKALNKLYGM
jgi:hypothetical protein